MAKILDSTLGAPPLDTGTLTRQRASTKEMEGAKGLTPEEMEVYLDLAQMVLDLAGILDPSPISDGTSMSISVWRGDWFGAGISGISMIPYVGDIAKAGKLGRWAQTVERAVRMARRNARFAARIRPVLKSLTNVLSQIPVAAVPTAARTTLLRLKQKLSGFTLPLSARESVLFERYLALWYRYIDDMPMARLKPGEGVLWAKLEMPGMDGAKISGESVSERLADMQGKFTLNDCLPDDFIRRYELAAAQLHELTGIFPWDEFGRKVWLRVSERYARNLQGQVTAYVRFHKPTQRLGKVLTEAERKAYKSLADDDTAILWDELMEISAAMEKSPGITSVVLTDIDNPMLRKIMTRDDVLKALRSRH